MSVFSRRFSSIVVTVAVLAILSGCVSSSARPSAGPTSPLLLISIDGFAAEYFDRYPDAMPNLQRLRREGVAAQGLTSVFPSNTFPSHYTLVTGLYPAQHGIINNEFFDPTNGRFFRYTQDSSVHDPRWWSGEPIWVTAIKQGKLAATSFWVGSEAAIGGVRPTYWRVFDAALPFETRLEEFVGWLKKPMEQRPALITFYLEETNGIGHRFGPRSPELLAAIKLVDARVGELLRQCELLGFTPNVVIASDHGMVEIDPQRVSILEDFIDVSSVQIETEGSVVGLRPLDGNIDSLLEKVSHIPHAQARRVEDLPAAFHWSENPRWSPVWILPDEGAHVARRAFVERLRQRYPDHGYLPGDHGYDPSVPSMHGIFIAQGPAFRRGVSLPQVESIHIYNLLCAVLGVNPAPNSGDDRLIREALRN